MSDFFRIILKYERGFFTLEEAKRSVVDEVNRLMFKAMHDSGDAIDDLGFFKIMQFITETTGGIDAFFDYLVRSYEASKNWKGVAA